MIRTAKQYKEAKDFIDKELELYDYALSEKMTSYEYNLYLQDTQYCFNILYEKLRVLEDLIEYLDYYKDAPIEEFPYFENQYSALSTKGYITEMSGGIYRGEYRIHIFYADNSNKVVRSVTVINKDQFDVLTNAIEPAVLQEIYDYLIDHA